MVASDKTIRELIKSGELKITPYKDYNIQPASIDLTLGDKFKFYTDSRLYMSKKPNVQETQGKRILLPSEFVLASTVETIELPNGWAASVKGRSSIMRMGLFVHNGGWVDPGYKGTITLTIVNVCEKPIVLEPGVGICQLVLEKVDCDSQYTGKYQGSTGVQETKLYMDK